MTKRIAWLVPAPLQGSGGHRTLYQNLAALDAAGYECHVYVEPPTPESPPYATRLEAKRIIESYFGRVPASFHLGFDVDDSFDVAFATTWFIAEPLRRLKIRAKKAYFIQDYEASFMPMSDGHLLAQNSYRFGFESVAIGRWLPHRLHEQFGIPCGHFDFCADRAVYRPLANARRERAVCFVYQPEKPRRCSLIGGQALSIVKAEMPDAKIYFYGSEAAPKVPFPIEHLGLLSTEECNALYNRVQVGLCISTTNPSRMPFEMMAAGLPTVDVFGDNNLYDYPESTVLLAEPTPESIAHAIVRLLRDEPGRRARSEAGLAWMAERDLPFGFKQFVAFVDAVARGDGTAFTQPQRIYRAEAFTADEATRERYERKRYERERIAAERAKHGPGGASRRSGRSPPAKDPLAKRAYRRFRATMKVFLTGRL